LALFKTNFCIFLLSPSLILSKPPNMMPITLLVARRIQCSNNHDKSPKIDLDKANHVFGFFFFFSDTIYSTRELN
jgi:hypothetical protein